MPLRGILCGAPAEQSGRGAGVERKLLRNGARHKVLDGAKRCTAPMVSTTRRLDNGDDCRQGRRGYCVGVGGDNTLGMTAIASDGGGSDDKKSLWL